MATPAEMWLPGQVREHRTSISRWHGRQRASGRRAQRPISYLERSEARLCSRSDSLRHILRYDVQVIEGINVNMPDSDGGIFIRFRKDGRLFNVKDFDAKTKTLKLLITELIYADDCALLAHSEECLQRFVDAFAAACKRFGLTISIKKTEVMLQTTPHAPRAEPRITIDNKPLSVVKRFTYLGSIVSDDCSLEPEIEARLKRASAAFGRLEERVWSKRDIRLSTKVSLYHAVVLSTLLYGCETWTLQETHQSARPFSPQASSLSFQH